MNRIFVGINTHIEIPRSGCLVIDDEVRVPRAKVFDPTIHSFNLLDRLDYRKACEIVDIIDALFSRGDGTLTKDTGLDFIMAALLKRPASLDGLIAEPDRKSAPGHVWAHSKVQRIFQSPVLKAALSAPATFSFNPRSVTVARINRAELGEFDALALGLFLMSHYPGQIVAPSFGFYAREMHSALLRQNRLIARVNFLDELPPELRQLVLLTNPIASGTTFEDAETLALHARIHRETTGFTDFVHEAMAVVEAEAPIQPYKKKPRRGAGGIAKPAKRKAAKAAEDVYSPGD